MAIKYVHRQADVSANAFPNRSQQAGLMVDSDDNKLKLNSDGTVDELVDTRHDFTLAGAVTVSGTLIQTGANRMSADVTAAAHATDTLTVADSGSVKVMAVDGAITLPLATVGAGVHFYIVAGVASVGTGVTVVAAGSDTFSGAGSLAGTTLTNTGSTDVVGDSVHVVSDGVSAWVVVGQRGTWAAS